MKTLLDYFRNLCSALALAAATPLPAIALALAFLAAFPADLGAEPPTSRLRDRLWIWGHPAGVFNNSYLAPTGLKSTIEPVAAAGSMGLRNMIFVRYQGKPRPPFESYFEPFKKLDRVYWSFTGSGGATSEVERRNVIRLAEENENIAGFILDDFFHVRPRLWLAANRPTFPVSLTLRPSNPVRASEIELVQTDWRSGDYRSKEIALELSADGRVFEPAKRIELPGEPAASRRLALPDEPFKAIRLRILSTHDTGRAMSCGLKSVNFFHDGKPLPLKDWKAEASSTYPGYPATSVLRDGLQRSASLSPEELRTLGDRRYRGDKKLPITAVVYVRQTARWLKPWLDEVDQVSLWTWRPGNLDHLEENLEALENLVPGKPILLGCYTYDFDESRPLPVARMKQQVELGHRWLREGRIAGMIFLATPNADLDLEAVHWTREWIARHGDERLP